jgi:threonine/homoserine/homoserine lactone efflux protein
MLELSGVFMVISFVVFAIYGLFAAAIRGQLVTRPAIMVWMRRTFAGVFVLLSARLALMER